MRSGERLMSFQQDKHLYFDIMQRLNIEGEKSYTVFFFVVCVH